MTKQKQNKEIEITIEGIPIKNFTKEEIDVYFKSSKPIRMIMEKAVQLKQKEMLDKFEKMIDERLSKLQDRVRFDEQEDLMRFARKDELEELKHIELLTILIKYKFADVGTAESNANEISKLFMKYKDLK